MVTPAENSTRFQHLYVKGSGNKTLCGINFKRQKFITSNIVVDEEKVRF